MAIRRRPGMPPFTGDPCDAVAACAPRLFAVVQLHPDQAGGRIAAWGLAFPDGADIVADGGFQMSVGDPERALDVFAMNGTLDVDLIWVDRDTGQRLERDQRASCWASSAL